MDAAEPDAAAAMDAVAVDQGLADAGAGDTGVSTDAEAPDAGTSDGGLLGIGEPCTNSMQCEGAVCHDFPMRGGLVCTSSCAAGACPVAGHTCTNMGLCRP